jgi:hypothetical protein
MKCADLRESLEFTSSVSQRSFRDAFKGLPALEYRLKDFETRMKKNYIDPDDMIRNRIYPVGATLGLLADALGVVWKEAAQKAGPDFAFHELLAKALPPGGRPAPALLEEVKGRYGYDTILAATTESVSAYKEGFRQALESFESQPGIRLEISFSYRSLSRSRVGAGRKWVMDDGAMTLCPTFRVFTLKNDNLTVETRENGVLENDDWDRKKKRVVFYVPEITSLRIDGAAQSPGTSVSGEFRTLELLGPAFAVKVKAAGAIDISGRRAAVSLKQP